MTHILTQEGYEGKGIDVRARTSWSHYPKSTQDNLQVHSFDPTSVSSDPYFRRGVFIIGNHADELTPWVPVVSTIYSASGYINIPCCAWTFDAKFDRSATSMFPIPDSDFADTLNLGGEGGNGSSYSMYRIWLASLTLHCGWEIECETLRIPSTRNWAIVGMCSQSFLSETSSYVLLSKGRRKSKTMTVEEAQENVLEVVKSVAERGIFKARKAEGRDSNIEMRLNALSVT